MYILIKIIIKLDSEIAAALNSLPFLQFEFLFRQEKKKRPRVIEHIAPR